MTVPQAPTGAPTRTPSLGPTKSPAYTAAPSPIGFVVQCYESTVYTPTSQSPTATPLCVDVELIELSAINGFALCLSVTTWPRGTCADSSASGELRGFFFNATAFGVSADQLYVDNNRFELANKTGFVTLQDTCTAPPDDKPLSKCGTGANRLPNTASWTNRLDFGTAFSPGTVSWSNADQRLGCLTIRSEAPIDFTPRFGANSWPVGVVAGGLGSAGAEVARLGQEICQPWTGRPTTNPTTRPTRQPVVRSLRPTVAPSKGPTTAPSQVGYTLIPAFGEAIFAIFLRS
jgi:hypothetical protein